MAPSTGGQQEYSNREVDDSSASPLNLPPPSSVPAFLAITAPNIPIWPPCPQRLSWPHTHSRHGNPYICRKWPSVYHLTASWQIWKLGFIVPNETPERGKLANLPTHTASKWPSQDLTLGPTLWLSCVVCQFDPSTWQAHISPCSRSHKGSPFLTCPSIHMFLTTFQAL